MIWWIGFPFLHLTYCCQMHYGPYFSSKLCKDYNVFEMLMYISQTFFQNQKSWFSNILTMGSSLFESTKGSVGPSPSSVLPHFKPEDGLGLTCNSNPFRHLKWKKNINLIIETFITAFGHKIRPLCCVMAAEYKNVRNTPQQKKYAFDL